MGPVWRVAAARDEPRGAVKLPASIGMCPHNTDGQADRRGTHANRRRPPRRAAAPTATFATLREIEGRLKSIRNIEKITNTMKIVASTKLTRAQRAMTDSRKYGQTSNCLLYTSPSPRD